MHYPQPAAVTSVLLVSVLSWISLRAADVTRQRQSYHYCLTIHNNDVPPPRAVTAIDPTQWSLLRRCLLLRVHV